MKKKYALTLYATVAESTGDKKYFTVGGDNESCCLAYKICPELAASTDALDAWLDTFNGQTPSWFYKTVGGPVHTENDIRKLLRNVK